MNDVQKGIVLTKQAASITSEALREMIQAFMQNKTTPKGEMPYSTLAKTGKLESIEITENNIGSFLSVAKKYDIDFALKRDSSTSPPTYHVFFAATKTENFKRAFVEYAANVQNKTKSAEYSVSREQIHKNAQKVAADRDSKKHEKERTLNKNQNISL